MKASFARFHTPTFPRIIEMILLFLIIFLIYAIFIFLNIPLQTKAAPYGIISFELAGSQDKVNQILSSWDNQANLFAAFGLGFDYLFLMVYAIRISLICLMASERLKGWFFMLGTWLDWGAFLAALLDSIENITLWNLLCADASLSWPTLAIWCASLKFAFILSGILYGLVGWVYPTFKNKYKLVLPGIDKESALLK